MATFNGGRYVGEQLQSFAEQSRLPDELVVSDDGSTDDTLEIVDRFASDCPFPVRVHRNRDRLGYSGNFERAIASCTGDIVLISDQDDVWFDDKIAVVVERLAAEQRPVILVNDQAIVGPDGARTGATIFGNSRRAGFPDTDLIAGSCTAIPSAFLSLLLPFPDRVPYDTWIGTIADALQVKRLIEQPLQIYRRHGANTTEPLAAARSPNRWTAFQRHGMRDPRDGWAFEIEWRTELARRLEQRRAETDALLGEARTAPAIRAVQERIDALQRRHALLGQPKWRRIPAVLNLWRSGFYGAFLGLKSALKDIIRP